MTVRGRMSSPNFLAASAWSISVKTMNPAASLCFTAVSNRTTVSFTEYLLGFVIRPSSAAYVVIAVTHMTSETASPTNKHLVTLILLLLCSYPSKRLSSPLTGTARSVHLDRRTPHRPVGAKYATVSGLRSQLNATASAFIDNLASINRHPL